MQWLRERVSTTVSQEPAAGAAEFFPISPIDPLGCASTRAIQKWSQNNLAASTFITNNITKMKISSGPQKSTFIIWIHAIVQFNTILIRLSCEFSRVQSCEVFCNHGHSSRTDIPYWYLMHGTVRVQEEARNVPPRTRVIYVPPTHIDGWVKCFTRCFTVSWQCVRLPGPHNKSL